MSIWQLKVSELEPPNRPFQSNLIILKSCKCPFAINCLANFSICLSNIWGKYVWETGIQDSIVL